MRRAGSSLHVLLCFLCSLLHRCRYGLCLHACSRSAVEASVDLPGVWKVLVEVIVHCGLISKVQM
jgi:hypothetical protein